MAKILITGGAGFIGSHVVDALIEKGHKVYVLDNLSSGKLENLNKKAVFIRGDIRDNLDDILRKIDIEYIYHFAAQISVRRSMDMPDVTKDINITGSLNLINFAVKRKVKKFIFSSSAAVYAQENSIPIKETAKTNPISPYGKSKLAIEKILISLSKSGKLDSVVLRYSNVFGPRQDAAGEAGVISLFFNAAINNRELSIFGDGKQTRDFIFVKDVAQANVLAMNLSGMCNVSLNKETSINNLTEKLIKVCNSKSSVVHKPKIEGEIFRSVSDNSKITKSGWKPSYNFDSALEETHKWFEKNAKSDGKTKKRILELCTFSAGGCGVFGRVKTEAGILANKGYEVARFSSNLEKGTNKIMPALDRIGNILIRRFPAVKLGGESFMNWNFEQEALKYKPDIIFAHSYRHTHTVKALKIAKKLGCKVYLVTHAPFARGSTRTQTQKAVVWFYDFFIGRTYLNKFDKIVTISNWEKPYLIDAGVKEKNIAYIPSGIPEEFFTIKPKGKEENKILFFGRVARIKRLETVIQALPLLKDKKIIFEIAGPREEDYYKELINLVAKLNLKERVIFTDAIYDVKKKIEKLDSARFCTLPSLSEGMPQALIEYMARKKIVFASNNPGSADIIKNKKNGLLFEIDNSKDFADKFNKVIEMKEKDREKIRKNALSNVRLFAWDNIIKKIENLI